MKNFGKMLKQSALAPIPSFLCILTTFHSVHVRFATIVV
jgi:hypothetical protein